MKKIVALALLAMSLLAAPYKVGEQVSALSLTDQHGESLGMKVMPKVLIMAFEKGTGATVNEYLLTQEKDYLAKNNASFVADISQMPNFVTEMFALPKMRKYPHTVLLIRDEEQGLRFPSQEGQITVMNFQDNVLTKVEFVDTTAELKAAIEK